MNTFMAHPSVRMKGSENTWNPKQCRDLNCPQNSKGIHMHCPFCVKTESYHDPVILRAHFRVKHVDKGLDFAGLKVLRCCESCDIIGAIKGEKKFKGAHWHCYRCRNGFNRRDEALKHFRTHFRNPHTTFQIQIAQDVSSPDAWDCSHANSAGIIACNPTTITVPAHVTEEITIHPVLTEAVMTTAPSGGSDSEVGGLTKAADSATISANGFTVAATETVNSEGAGQAVILIESVAGEEGSSAEETTVYHTVNDEDTFRKENMDQKLELEKQLAQFQDQNAQLQHDKTQTEKQLKAEIQKLRDQVQHLSSANTVLQQQLQSLQNSTLQRLSIDNQADLQQLLGHLEQEHSNLLQHHLAQLRQYCFSNISRDNTDQITHVPIYESNSSQDETIQQIVVTTQAANSDEMNTETITTTALGEMCRETTHDSDDIVITHTNGHYVVKEGAKTVKGGMPELVIVEVKDREDTNDNTESASPKRKSDFDGEDSPDAKRKK